MRPFISYHVCHFALDELEVADGLAELLPLVRVLPRNVAGSLQKENSHSILIFLQGSMSWLKEEISSNSLRYPSMLPQLWLECRVRTK